MKSSKFVTYLTQVGKYEQRIQIARQILAQNMNFSPAWLIAILQSNIQSENKKDKEKNVLTISQFKLLFSSVGFICDNQELIQVFEYFDRQNKGVIKNSDFVEFLLPTIRDGLRKAAIKRTVQDIQLTFELKLGLRRLFSQILGARAGLKLYEGDFGAHTHKLVQSTTVSKQSIKKFLNKYCKYPTETQLTLICNFVTQQKSKQVSLNQICSIIEQSQKQIEYLAKNPIVLNQKIQNQLINLKVKEVQGAREVQKIVLRGQLQSQRKRNLYQNPQQNLFSGWQKLKQQEQSKDKINKIQMKQINQSPTLAYKKYANQKNQPISSNQSKQRINQPFSHPNFKIPRTTSIIHTQQKINENNKQRSNQLKRASQLADKLLTKPQNVKNKQTTTPFKKLQSAPTIFYPSRMKSAQSDFTLLVNNNLQTEGQILQHKKQNQNRMKQIKQYMRSEVNY